MQSPVGFPGGVTGAHATRVPGAVPTSNQRQFWEIDAIIISAS